MDSPQIRKRKASEDLSRDEATPLRTVPQPPPTSLSTPEPEPTEEVPVSESETVPEAFEEQALPAVGPVPTLPMIDSTQKEPNTQTNNDSSIPDANAETRVRWTIPGMPRDSVRSLPKLKLPVRRFGSRVGNAAMRNDKSSVARSTLQAKKSKWLSETKSNQQLGIKDSPLWGELRLMSTQDELLTFLESQGVFSVRPSPLICEQNATNNMSASLAY
ncbi:hypothetical protein FCOIX_12027 [Fusarium coicis]|nr:hypothetical protein FCOIX_12027 [Fusarium coicis]